MVRFEPSRVVVGVWYDVYGEMFETVVVFVVPALFPRALVFFFVVVDVGVGVCR